MKFTVIASTLISAVLVSAQTLNIPTRNGNIISLKSAMTLSGSNDFGNKEYDRGVKCDTDDDTGSDNAVFILNDGATLSNVIIGADQLEGVHCKGSCTLKNVWFRDVCEDAITLEGSGTVLIQGGGAQNAKDKVVQANGLKLSTTIKDYTVVSVGKLYRSCGNCSKNGGPRNVVVSNVKANKVTADLVGINSNYGDVATISGSCGKSVSHVCQEFKGILKSEGGESKKLSTTANCQGAQGKLSTLPSC